MLCKFVNLHLGFTYSEGGTHEETLHPQRSLKSRTRDEGTLDTTRQVVDHKTDAVIA